MINLETVINTTVTLPFTSTGNVTGLNSFTSIVLNNGIVTTPALTFVEIGSGLYTISFTPLSTGIYTVFLQTSIVAVINVVNQDKFTFLQDIEDSLLGSWTWDKQTGVITMLTQAGITLATFNATDTPQLISRERV